MTNEILAVFGLFTLVMCGLVLYVHTHREEDKK